MVEFNAALSPCGVTGAACYFFESSRVSDESSLALVAQALALEAEEVFFEHSLALCPGPPQNMQRLLAKCCKHSSGVSLPSFPSLLGRSGFLHCPDVSDVSELGLLLEEDADLLSECCLDDEDEDDVVCFEVDCLLDLCSLEFLSDLSDFFELSLEISDCLSQ